MEQPLRAYRQLHKSSAGGGEIIDRSARETANAYWKRYITLAALESHPGRRNSEEEYQFRTASRTASAIPAVLLGERVTPRVLATASTDGLQAFSRPRVRNKSGVVPDLFRPEAAQVNGVGSMGRG